MLKYVHHNRGCFVSKTYAMSVRPNKDIYINYIVVCFFICMVMQACLVYPWEWSVIQWGKVPKSRPVYSPTPRGFKM